MLGVLSEGCMESLAEQLPTLFPIVARAAQQPNDMLRRHGLLCIGYWCE
jgi:hypothetical protein